MTGAEISKQCGCGGTLAVPSHQTESGYEACPDCTKIFPHRGGETCIYCGQFLPEGPCPADNHPNLTKQMCCLFHASGGSLTNSCGGDFATEASA